MSKLTHLQNATFTDGLYLYNCIDGCYIKARRDTLENRRRYSLPCFSLIKK